MVRTVLVSALACAALAAQAAPPIEPVDDLVVSASITLKPGVYKLKDARGDGLFKITADGVVIDGAGATIVGPDEGVGITAKGLRGVTVKNLVLRGFATACDVEDGLHWSFVDCDFSAVPRDPLRLIGPDPESIGIRGRRLRSATLRGVAAESRRVGVLLERSDECTLEDVRATRAEDVGLLLRASSRNKVTGCDFSGATPRTAKGRTSLAVGVSLEGGADDNVLEGNAATGCVDGFVLRVEEGPICERNVLRGNDASGCVRAGFDVRFPRNQLIRNKAHRCGVGVRLESADECVVAENDLREAGADPGCKTPDEGGAAGVAIVGGGCHLVVERNVVTGAKGPGILVRGAPPAFPAHHVLLQGNQLDGNAEGVRLERCDFIDLRGNRVKGTPPAKAVVRGDRVRDVLEVSEEVADKAGAPPRVSALPPRTLGTAKQPVTLQLAKPVDPERKPTFIRWRFDDRDLNTTGEREQTRTWDQPGFYRVSVFADDGGRASLAHTDVFIVPPGPEFSDRNASAWALLRSLEGAPAEPLPGTLEDDPVQRVKGASALKVVAAAPDVALAFPRTRDAAWDLSEKRSLQLWMRWRLPPGATFLEGSPWLRLVTEAPKVAGAPAAAAPAGTIEVRTADGKSRIGRDAPYSQGRWSYVFLDVPLRKGADWVRRYRGAYDWKKIDAFEIHVAATAPGFELHVDGVQFSP